MFVNGAKVIRKSVSIMAASSALVLSLGVCAEKINKRDPMDYVAPDYRPALEKRKGSFGAMEFSAETLPKMREGTKTWETPFLDTPKVEAKSLSGLPGEPDVNVYVINADADASTPRPAIIHTHGGGYILGSAKASVPSMQAIAKKHNCVVVTVDYRLAPETAFPGSLYDNYAALKWVYNNAQQLGVDRDRLVVMGDSAGGGHAAMLALEARKRGEIPLKAQVLIYPMLDDRTGSAVPQPDWMGYLSWSASANRFGWSSLLGVPAGSDKVPAGSVPARVENLAGLPETFIGVGSIDLFVDEDIEYARRLIRAGVSTELFVLPGGYHGFQTDVPDAPDSKRFHAAVDRALERAFTQ